MLFVAYSLIVFCDSSEFCTAKQYPASKGTCSWSPGTIYTELMDQLHRNYDCCLLLAKHSTWHEPFWSLECETAIRAESYQVSQEEKRKLAM